MNIFKKRREKILNSAKDLEFDVVVASNLENLYYLTGFRGSGMVIIDESKTLIFTQTLDKGKAEIQASDCEIIDVKVGNSLYDFIIEALKGRRVLFDDLRVSIADKVRERVKDVKFDPQFFYKFRRRKDYYEIECIKKAAMIIDKLFEFANEILSVGVSERQVAGELISKAILMGCTFPIGSASNIIIASGINSTYPHAEPTDKKLNNGDLIIVDLFFMYEGYVADATRTFGLGSLSNEVKEVYEAVREVQELGIKSIADGTFCKDIDKVCRDRLIKKGLADFFIHSTGHGVGLEVHEPPWLRPNSNDVLMKGDVVTIEPGVYIPNKFGIRIEDTIYVSHNVEILTKFPKELIIL
ncbi:MAG: Xaa-Pro peptidase family protein [Nitrososphaerales archaeon]